MFAQHLFTPVQRICLIALVWAVVFGLRWTTPVATVGIQSATGSSVANSLASLYDVASGAVRDSNGDGLADSVAARIIVPADPTIEDIQAAANIAGRLGFETTALTLPVVIKASDVPQGASIAFPILVGRGNPLIKKLTDQGALDLKDLKPGQALVTVVDSPLGGPAGIAVVGGDDAGTLNGATALAAYLPRLWGATGARLAQVDAQITRYLRSKNVSTLSHGVTGLVVDSDRRGIATIIQRVSIAPGEAARATKAIEDLDLLHRRGLEADTLNYTNAAATRIDLYTDGRKTASAVVKRSGLNGRTLTPPDDEFGRGAGPGGDAAANEGGGRGSTGGEANAASTGEGAGGGGGGGGQGGGPAIPAKTYDLSQVYSLEGWFGDLYTDLLPDRLETSIVVGDAKESLGAAHIATRLGLETTGVTLPLARDHRKVTNAATEVNAILVGRSNDLVQQLTKIGKVRLDDLKPGEGAIEIVPRAFGPSTVTVVAGADAAGTDAATNYLARRLPYVWDIDRGSLNLADLKRQAADFFALRTGAAHASLALREIEDVLKTLQDKKIESFDAKVFLESKDPGVDKFLTARVREALKDTPTVAVTSQGITDPVTVFEDKVDMAWEVDDFWARFEKDVLPKVKAGSSVSLEARLSESPEIRKGVADRARATLIKAGAKDPKVRILSAYKQGYLWLTEVVIPELKGKGAKAVSIKIATNNPDLTKKFRFYEVPSRWLHELYPVDEIIERELGIPKSAFGMELVDDPKEIYSLEATNGGGQPVYKATFSPKFVEREYLDKFPGWSRVKVTTGWVSATVDGQSAIDARIETDPERFWDVYQQKSLPKIHDYVMRITQNRPTVDKQPYHRDLDVEVWMSEPDFRIGVDEEQVSSLESLHEDLYFGTLDFFVALGRTVLPSQARLNAPGKVYPIIHPSREGKPGQARILYAGNASARARLEITYKEPGQDKPTRVQRDLTRIEGTEATVVRAIVKADRISEIELEMTPRDDREAGRGIDLAANLVRLQEAGLYRSELSFNHVDRIAVTLATRDAQARRVIANTGVAAPSNVRLTSGAKPKLPIVTWDEVISPDRSEELVKQLSAFPAVKAYKAGRSYRGRDISVMELTLPTTSELISVAKYSAFKPTIFITGRQHANEVSSTSHILKLAEMLATDPSYKDILKKVNVVLHPVENPDGAQMAYDLQKLTPTHMLHAGRYSALGQDVGSNSALLPESQVRGKIWREWLPDIYLNPHGYPSHEWVQQFAGYVPPGFRSYWSTRGWWTQLSGVRDPREPDLIDATEGLREEIVRTINGNADVRAMNLRSQARYRRWAYGFSPSIYGQEIYKETAIYFTDPETGEARGGRRIGGGRGGTGVGRGTMNQYPQVTFNIGMTEAPDETAQGDWLRLVNQAGLSFVQAHIDYLRNGQYTIERIEEAGQRDSVSLTQLRVRPVKPGRANGISTRSGGSGR